MQIVKKYNPVYREAWRYRQFILGCFKDASYLEQLGVRAGTLGTILLKNFNVYYLAYDNCNNLIGICVTGNNLKWLCSNPARQGVGSTLLKLAVRDLKKQGRRCLFMRVSKNSMPFYLKHDFKILFWNYVYKKLN